MTRNSAARQRLFDAALELFAQRGTTDISVIDLANAAGVARGTVYKHLSSTEQIYHELVDRLASDMNQQIGVVIDGVADPAVRHATGIRLYVRRAHQSPDWGKFLVKFGLADSTMREIWNGAPLRDLLRGIKTKRYEIAGSSTSTAMGLMIGATVSAIALVLNGENTWRQAGSDAAFLVLRAYGVPRDEANKIANAELPSNA
jgi:AcrR family transcriptional regulator